MKRFFLFLALVSGLFCCLLAEAQTYQVTEAQLQKLEAICQSYKASNQKLQSQLDELKQTAQGLRTESENLKQDSKTLQEQLERERTSMRNLNESLLKSENKNAQIEAERNALIIQAEQQDQKIKDLRRKARSLTAAIITMAVIAIAGGILFVWAKLKGLI